MDQINSVLNFWFPDDQYQKWWCKSTPELDTQIYTQYYQLMLNMFDNFLIDNYQDPSPEQLIYGIIVLDQFSRNINRIVQNLNIGKYTDHALQLTNKWIELKYYLTCPIKWTVFAFLPIRHTKNNQKIKELDDLLNQIEKQNNLITSNQIFKKFKSNTKRQMLMDHL
jgi:uncharacterized protein (DUF924 family)